MKQQRKAPYRCLRGNLCVCVLITCSRALSPSGAGNRLLLLRLLLLLFYTIGTSNWSPNINNKLHTHLFLKQKISGFG